MEGHAEMEMLRTLKGPSTGEVSVHLVARDSPGSGSHLPTAAFIIPGGPSQGSGGTGESTSMPKQMWVLGRRRYFSPASALAWQGWSRVVRLTCVVICPCICSQPARPPWVCPAVPWMCPAFRGSRCTWAPRSERPAAYLSQPQFCRS